MSVWPLEADLTPQKQTTFQPGSITTRQFPRRLNFIIHEPGCLEPVYLTLEDLGIEMRGNVMFTFKGSGQHGSQTVQLKTGTRSASQS